MKTLIVFILSLFLTTQLFADCASSGLHVWPAGTTLKQNPIIVLEGYAQSQELITQLNSKFPVYLKAHNYKVKLNVKEICKGQFELTQAILIPSEKLIAGLEYTLTIDSLPKDQSLTRYNPKTQKNERIKFKILEGIDTLQPVITAKPTVIKKSLVQLGCGPVTYVYFDCPIVDSSEFLVKTTVKNLKTGKESTYHIMPYTNNMQIGHGMCSGAFTFFEGDKYEAEFSVLDASGNFTAWIGERIRFTKPVKEGEVKEN